MVSRFHGDHDSSNEQVLTKGLSFKEKDACEV